MTLNANVNGVSRNAYWPAATGRVMLAIGVAVFGLLCLLFSDYVSGLQPVPQAWPARLAGAWLTGVVLLALGGGLLHAQTRFPAAVALAVVLLGWCAALHLPILIATARNGSAWVGAFETLALAGAALVLAGIAHDSHASSQPRKPGEPALIRAGRLCFGIALPVFAASHFIYAEFVATLVPEWIPARLFWAWFTGAAHLLAGLAIVSGIQVRLAAMLAGAMYASWALILHLPRVLPDPGNRAEVTSLFVAIALSGAAWVVAGSRRHGDLGRRNVTS